MGGWILSSHPEPMHRQVVNLDFTLIYSSPQTIMFNDRQLCQVAAVAAEERKLRGSASSGTAAFPCLNDGFVAPETSKRGFLLGFALHE